MKAEHLALTQQCPSREGGGWGGRVQNDLGLTHQKRAGASHDDDEDGTPFWRETARSSGREKQCGNFPPFLWFLNVEARQSATSWCKKGKGCKAGWARQGHSLFPSQNTHYLKHTQAYTPIWSEWCTADVTHKKCKTWRKRSVCVWGDVSCEACNWKMWMAALYKISFKYVNAHTRKKKKRKKKSLSVLRCSMRTDGRHHDPLGERHVSCPWCWNASRQPCW